MSTLFSTLIFWRALRRSHDIEHSAAAAMGCFGEGGSNAQHGTSNTQRSGTATEKELEERRFAAVAARTVQSEID